MSAKFDHNTKMVFKQGKVTNKTMDALVDIVEKLRYRVEGITSRLNGYNGLLKTEEDFKRAVKYHTDGEKLRLAAEKVMDEFKVQYGNLGTLLLAALVAQQVPPVVKTKAKKKVSGGPLKRKPTMAMVKKHTTHVPTDADMDAMTKR